MRKLYAAKCAGTGHIFCKLNINVVRQIGIFFTQLNASEASSMNYVIRLYKIKIFKKTVNRFKQERLCRYTRQLNNPLMNTKDNIIGVFGNNSPIKT